MFKQNSHFSNLVVVSFSVVLVNKKNKNVSIKFLSVSNFFPHAFLILMSSKDSEAALAVIFDVQLPWLHVWCYIHTMTILWQTYLRF